MVIWVDLLMIYWCSEPRWHANSYLNAPKPDSWNRQSRDFLVRVYRPTRRAGFRDFGLVMWDSGHDRYHRSELLGCLESRCEVRQLNDCIKRWSLQEDSAPKFWPSSWKGTKFAKRGDWIFALHLASVAEIRESIQITNYWWTYDFSNAECGQEEFEDRRSANRAHGYKSVQNS